MNGLDDRYPFGALVGQEPLKTALLLGAVDPSLGGVLIRGEKGTAKSTAARALTRLLPPIRTTQGCPFRCDPDRPWLDCPCCTESAEASPVVEIPTPHVDLPLGATEDRVLGTLDLDRVLRESRTSLKPGLLAQANRGVLYIDEVNLLPDHLVDALLDVATSGVNTVQRDGVSARHPARFLLIGSMNPEEGELRPQLLDRFGLMVEVAAPTDFELRAEVVRRRLAFECDPSEFSARWADEDRAIGRRIAEARQRLADVVVPDGLLTAIARLCCESQVDGLRADIALYKAARALAALDGRRQVRRDDLRTAAAFVLPHRRRRQPFQQPGLDQDAIDRALGDDGDDERDTPSPSESRNGSEERDDSLDRHEPGSSEPDDGPPSEGDAERVIDPGGPIATPRLDPDPVENVREVRLGTHPVRAAATATRGRYVRAVANESPRDLAVDATLRAAARRGAGVDGVLTIERGDLHDKRREAPAGALIVFVVDASGSMGARKRMEAVKAAVLALLGDAYQRRDQTAVVAFRGARAEVALAPSRSVERAESVLRRLPTGGRTPLAHALTTTAELLASERRGGPAVVVLLTDGKANVPLPGSAGDPWTQAKAAAARIAATGVSTVVFDTEEGFGRVGRAAELAETMEADLVPLAQLSADAVRSRIRPPRARGN